MKLIQAGDNGIDFNLTDNRDQEIRLSNFKGKQVLLSWHPLAWTPVCTDQMRALETNWQRFQQLNTVPLGLSVDAAPCKKVWAAALVSTNVSLLADFWPHGKVAQDYGIFNEQDGVSERANIIIDQHGKVKWVKVYPASQLPDIEEVIQVLAH